MTLPIDSRDGLAMDPVEARQFGALLHEGFKAAQPFPHIVLEDFLPLPVLQRALDGFPPGQLASDGVFESGYAGLHKRQIMPEDCGHSARELFWFFNSRPVLQFLEGLTGIEGLLPDPYFVGGGYHETGRGGKLGVHADFRIHSQLHVQRRLNIIIYLNDVEWDDAWFGHLELWSRDMKTLMARVAPRLNRCVIFQTEADTWHGHPDPLATPEGVTRRSIALYYYTASPSIHDELPDTDTVYMARPDEAAQDRREARSLWLWERLRDWVPPVVYRRLLRLRWRLR